MNKLEKRFARIKKTIEKKYPQILVEYTADDCDEFINLKNRHNSWISQFNNDLDTITASEILRLLKRAGSTPLFETKMGMNYINI